MAWSKALVQSRGSRASGPRPRGPTARTRAAGATESSATSAELTLGHGPHRGDLHGQRLPGSSSSTRTARDSSGSSVLRCRSPRPSSIPAARPSRAARPGLLDQIETQGGAGSAVGPDRPGAGRPSAAAREPVPGPGGRASSSRDGIAPLQSPADRGRGRSPRAVPRTDDLGELLRAIRLERRWNRARARSVQRSTNQSVGRRRTRAEHRGADPAVRGIPARNAQEPVADPRVVALSQCQRHAGTAPADPDQSPGSRTFSSKAGDRSSRRAASWTAWARTCGTGSDKCDSDVFVSQGLQALERPEGVDPRLGQGGSGRDQELAQRFDRRRVLALVDQAVGRVAVPGVGTQRARRRARPSWPGSNEAAARTGTPAGRSGRSGPGLALASGPGA